MSLEKRMKKAYESLKAPKGKFAVYVWNPSDPEESTPMQISKPYTVKEFAMGYAKKMNAKEESAIGEAEYFVIDDRGIRIY